MRVLCVDQSSRTGYAFGVERSNEPFAFGSFSMPKRDALGERLVIFRDGLVDKIERFKPDMIGYETPFFPIGNAGQAQGQRAAFSVKTIGFLKNLEGVLIETASRHGVAYECHPSSSWRVTALGFGRLPKGSQVNFKKLMVTRAKALGYDVKDDNEADALGLLLHMLNGRPAALRAQTSLLELATANL